MRKSLQLQAELADEFGAACSTSRSIAKTAPRSAAKPSTRTGRGAGLRWPAGAGRRARAPGGPRCIRAGHRHHRRQGGHALCHLMVPKVEPVQDVERASHALARPRRPPPGACAHRIPGGGAPRTRHRRAPAHAVARFGLMEFVSAHGGAIPSDGHGRRRPVHAPAGGARQARDRVRLPCPRQGTLALAWSPNSRLDRPARRGGGQRTNSVTRGCGASTRTRSGPSWKLRAQRDRNRQGRKIHRCADRANWAPISHDGQLEDRASYRYYWHVLERAHRTGRSCPPECRAGFRTRVHQPHGQHR